MARAYTKCADCNDIMWFQDTDGVPQHVICPCGATELKESGPEGNFTTLTQQEIDDIPT